ncbi:MAG: septum formation initiator family protein [Lachnospiraceae bacterium]|nr:septum formation initiator family protein [Lachnospiraceae bacterium]
MRKLSRKRRRKKRKQNSKGISIIVFVVIIFCAAVGIRTYALKNQSEELAKRQAALEKQMESEEQRTKELEELEKYMKTKKYVEEVAKEKLGLVYPDEILIEPENK